VANLKQSGSTTSSMPRAATSSPPAAAVGDERNEAAESAGNGAQQDQATDDRALDRTAYRHQIRLPSMNHTALRNRYSLSV